MKDDIGIPKEDRFTVHSTRHTFVSNLIAKGASIYQIKELLGHTTVTTTEMYAHLFTEQLKDVTELLNDDPLTDEDEE